MHLAFIVPLVLVIVLAFVDEGISAKISHFNIVRTSNGRVIRKLKRNEMLRFPFGFTLSAVVTAPVHNVTFSTGYESIYSYVSTSAPHILLGVTRFPQGQLTANAYIDGDRSNKLEVPFRVRYPGYPLYGPSSLQVTPSSFLRPAFRKINIPVVSGCKLPSPKLLALEMWRNSYCAGQEPALKFQEGLSLYYRVTACEGEKTVRTRLMEAVVRKSKSGPPHLWTRVLNAELDTVSYEGDYLYKDINLFCARGPVYGEVCTQRKGFAPKCVTSKLQSLEADGSSGRLSYPMLKFRPPIELQLAPGDKANIVLATRDLPRGVATYTTAFGTGEMYGGVNKTDAIRLVAQGRGGRVLQRSGAARNGRAVLRLGGKDGVSSVDWNGAVVFYEYWRESCPSHKVVRPPKFGTKVTVRRDIKPLMKQDTRLPTFPQPTLKPTAVGDPVTISVRATNPGGGRRAGGTPTELTYQWYRLYWFEYGSADNPIPLEGETSPTLLIPELVSFYFYYGHGSSSLHTYFVDVCNTYGCRRSDGIDLGTLLSDYFLDIGSGYC